MRLQNELAKVPESEQTPKIREKIFKEVMGEEKRGRVLTYGHGPSFKDVFGKESECPADIAIRTTYEEANAANKLLREELVATKACQVNNLLHLVIFTFFYRFNVVICYTFLICRQTCRHN